MATLHSLIWSVYGVGVVDVLMILRRFLQFLKRFLAESLLFNCFKQRVKVGSKKCECVGSARWRGCCFTGFSAPSPLNFFEFLNSLHINFPFSNSGQHQTLPQSTLLSQFTRTTKFFHVLTEVTGGTIADPETRRTVAT